MITFLAILKISFLVSLFHKFYVFSVSKLPFIRLLCINGWSPSRDCGIVTMIKKAIVTEHNPPSKTGNPCYDTGFPF